MKVVRAKTQAAWSTSKKILALLSGWGLIFSMVTICKLAVAFEYDDGLVFSAPAYAKAVSAHAPYSPQFWSALNRSYDIEKPKYMMQSLAWLFRVFGFRVAILADRPSTDGEALCKEWRHLTPKAWFYFLGDRQDRRDVLAKNNYVFFFASNDSAILDARKAGIYVLRVRRSDKSNKKEDYNPGTLNEMVLPGSQF